MWTDCANIFSVVWLRVFFMPGGLTQDVKVMSWRLAKVWVMFGHYIKTTVINPDYVNNEKIYFYFSENLEFIYHNHPGITLLFRYLITHLKERNTWDCGWLEEPSLTWPQGKVFSAHSAQHCRVSGTLGWLLEPLQGPSCPNICFSSPTDLSFLSQVLVMDCPMCLPVNHQTAGGLTQADSNWVIVRPQVIHHVWFSPPLIQSGKTICKGISHLAGTSENIWTSTLNGEGILRCV